MSFIPPLAIGSVISNKQLSAMFKVGNMGGMRRSKATGSLVLICDNTKRVNPGYFKIPHRTQFGNAFLEFMKENGKLLNEEKKAMSNILLHGFVSDHKSGELFDFLYSYYSIDLARDINMLDRDAMNLSAHIGSFMQADSGTCTAD